MFPFTATQRTLIATIGCSLLGGCFLVTHGSGGSSGGGEANLSWPDSACLEAEAGQNLGPKAGGSTAEYPADIGGQPQLCLWLWVSSTADATGALHARIGNHDAREIDLSRVSEEDARLFGGCFDTTGQQLTTVRLRSVASEPVVSRLCLSTGGPPSAGNPPPVTDHWTEPGPQGVDQGVNQSIADSGPGGVPPAETGGGRDDQQPGETDGGGDGGSPSEPDVEVDAGGPPPIEQPPHFVASGEAWVEADAPLAGGGGEQHFEPAESRDGCPTGAVLYTGPKQDEIESLRVPRLTYPMKTDRAGSVWVWLGAPRRGGKGKNEFWVWFEDASGYGEPREVQIGTKEAWNWAGVGRIELRDEDRVELQVAGHTEESLFMELRLTETDEEPPPPELHCLPDE